MASSRLTGLADKSSVGTNFVKYGLFVYVIDS